MGNELTLRVSFTGEAVYKSLHLKEMTVVPILW